MLTHTHSLSLSCFDIYWCSTAGTHPGELWLILYLDTGVIRSEMMLWQLVWQHVNGLVTNLIGFVLGNHLHFLTYDLQKFMLSWLWKLLLKANNKHLRTCNHSSKKFFYKTLIITFPSDQCMYFWLSIRFSILQNEIPDVCYSQKKLLFLCCCLST